MVYKRNKTTNWVFIYYQAHPLHPNLKNELTKTGSRFSKDQHSHPREVPVLTKARSIFAEKAFVRVPSYECHGLIPFFDSFLGTVSGRVIVFFMF